MKKILIIKNLTKIFNPGTHAEVKAVQGIDFELNKGEIVLIMGPSGSGKTTFLTMIGALLKPSLGEIHFDQKNLTKYSFKELTQFRRDNLGFIFQSFNLLENLSAIENVEIACFKKGPAKEEAEKLLNRLGLEKRLHAKPKDLSGGESQRVAVARALINDPLLILADEPTANLDRKIGHNVMDLLCSIACEEGKSVVIVSHDERIKDFAHRVIYIEDGRFIREEEGGHNKFCQMHL